MPDWWFVGVLVFFPSLALAALLSYATGVHMAVAVAIVVPACVVLAAVRTPRQPALAPEVRRERQLIVDRYVGGAAATTIAVSAGLAMLDLLPDALQLAGVLGFWFGGPLTAVLVSRHRLSKLEPTERAEVDHVLREEFYGVRLDALRRRSGLMWWSLVMLVGLLVVFAVMVVAVTVFAD